MSGEPGETAALPGLEQVRRIARAATPPPERAPAELAASDPVAQVLVDVPLAHLDRPFDYAVPATMADTARAGVRVKVRFAGKDVNGFVLSRVASSAHPGRLQPLRKVVSDEPVLTADVAELTALVARRWAGTRSDVLRLAVPPRHARVEKEPQRSPPDAGLPAPDPAGWTHYGSDVLERLARGEPARAVWSVLPGDDGAALLAEALATVAHGGRGALACVPDHRDLARLDAALTARIGEGHHVVLSAEAGPAQRYRAFLATSRGAVRVVIGNRAAAFAPVRDLGLVAIWDDGDDLHAEPRAPYPHAREVLLLRAAATGSGAVLAAHARSVEAEYLLRSGWAEEVQAPRELRRARAAVAATEDSGRDSGRDPAAWSRLPRSALQLLRQGLEEGPVLVQAPRTGYRARLACELCRTPTSCPACHGPLAQTGAGRAPVCTWCATVHADWHCAECGSTRLRAPVIGDARTAEELGRALPGFTVRQSSSGERVLSEVDERPAIVVATPGAEPPARGGYAAVLLLDSWLLLARADLRATEEAFRRWANAAALVRPADQGGRVLLVGDAAHAGVQALVRWDPGGLVRREIDDRVSAHLPPASRVATLTAEREELEAFLAVLELPDTAELLGPAPAEVAGAPTGAPLARVVVRVPRAAGAALAEALHTVQAQRSTRKRPHVRVEVDPVLLG